MVRGSFIPRPPKRSRTLFALTPLIDVMFLLLIFFMLSSQISPYSLIPIRQVAAAIDADVSPAEQPGSRELVLRVLHGAVNIAGRNLAIADLSKTLDDLASRGFSGVVVTAGVSATVQDIVSTLEQVDTSSIRRVTLATPSGTAR